jgi:4-oxalmesaconate hydratase
MTIFSPRAMGMSHHIGDYNVSLAWSQLCNEMIHRVCALYPNNFIGVCQLPQSPGVSPDSCIGELERCVKEFGFVGCNLNPDPSGGHWTAPPLTDRWWYKLYEKMVELDVPAMVHVSASCNPCFHGTGAHYINADTTAFMQLIMGDLFKDFPTLMMKNNVWFDTCVYHQPGIDLLTKVVPIDNILFASEMVGAVRGKDPQTGYDFDDTKRYVDGAQGLSGDDKKKIFEGNALRAYPRLKSKLSARTAARR